MMLARIASSPRLRPPYEPEIPIRNGREALPGSTLSPVAADARLLDVRCDVASGFAGLLVGISRSVAGLVLYDEIPAPWLA
jgi:hypothetical protein